MICVVVSCVPSPYHRLKGSAPSTTKHKARNAGTFRFSAGGRQQSVAFWCSWVQHFGDFGIGRKFKNWHHLSYKFCRWIANPDLERWKPFGIPAGRRKGCFPEKKYQKPGGWKGSLSLKCWKKLGNVNSILKSVSISISIVMATDPLAQEGHHRWKSVQSQDEFLHIVVASTCGFVYLHLLTLIFTYIYTYIWYSTVDGQIIQTLIHEL